MTDSSQARQIAEQWLDEHWTEHAFTAKWTNRHKMNVPDQTSLPELLTSFAAHTRRSEALREAAEVVGCRLCRKGVPIDGKSSDSAEERK